MKKYREPLQFVSREQCLKDSEQVLALPDIPIRRTEDIFRIRALGMDWDIGAMVYEPEERRRIPVDAGVHAFWSREKDLAMGIAPSVVRLWNDAILSGFFRA